jgi:phosphopantetheinyl transferase
LKLAQSISRPGPREVHLHFLWGAHEADPSEEQLFSFPDIEREEAGRLGSLDRRREFLWSRFFLRQLLAAYLGEDPKGLSFQRGPWGKPRLARTDLHFNLSHTEGLIVCSFARFPVGVDVERMDRRVRSARLVAKRWFSEAELRYLEKGQGTDHDRDFIRIFTLKEAHTKAVGKGLSLPGGSFTVPLEGAGGEEGWDYLSQTLRRGGFSLAHAAPRGPGTLRYRRTHWRMADLIHGESSSSDPSLSQREVAR